MVVQPDPFRGKEARRNWYPILHQCLAISPVLRFLPSTQPSGGPKGRDTMIISNCLIITIALEAESLGLDSLVNKSFLQYSVLNHVAPEM